jgi:membrane associated rhomboid family serine protease
VLTAAGIPNAVEADGSAWVVLAAADDLARAHAALAGYDDERERRVEMPPAVEPYPWMSGVALGLLLVWLFTLTGRPGPGSRWFEHGAAAAGRILSGELWRAVTALTLHADAVHVTGNAVATAILVPPLVQRFGAGASLGLLLLAGALGNVLAALTHDPRHVAVGFSTATFGAVGILTALRLVPGGASTRGKRWTAVVAGLLLLATLGAAPGADLTAHAFGFVAGLVVGALAGLAVRRRPRAVVQWVLGAAAAAVVMGCWWVALPAS